MKMTLILLAIFGILQISFSQKTLLPRDETSKDVSLAMFVGELKNAISTKDENWIYNALDESVISTYGDEEGIESFNRYWSPENDSTDFWPYLSRVVSLGGVFLHDTADETGRFQFVFPYTYDVDLDIEDDYFMTGAITGKNVNVRSAPNANADVITQLSHNIIYYIPLEEAEYLTIPANDTGDPQWVHITTYDKKTKGWVNWKYVYSLFGPRLFLFKDKHDQWKISAFVEGD